jgi:hypothetical protein
VPLAAGGTVQSNPEINRYSMYCTVQEPLPYRPRLPTLSRFRHHSFQAWICDGLCDHRPALPRFSGTTRPPQAPRFVNGQPNPVQSNSPTALTSDARSKPIPITSVPIFQVHHGEVQGIAWAATHRKGKGNWGSCFLSVSSPGASAFLFGRKLFCSPTR